MFICVCILECDCERIIASVSNGIRIRSMTDAMISLNSAALSLVYSEGDVNRVESLINKYNYGPKGLWYSVVDVCTCL